MLNITRDVGRAETESARFSVHLPAGDGDLTDTWSDLSISGQGQLGSRSHRLPVIWLTRSDSEPGPPAVAVAANICLTLSRFRAEHCRGYAHIATSSTCHDHHPADPVEDTKNVTYHRGRVFVLLR